MTEPMLRSVRIYVDLPLNMYRALVAVCERAQCSLPALLRRIAEKGLDWQADASTPPPPAPGPVVEGEPRVIEVFSPQLVEDLRNARHRLTSAGKRIARDHQTLKDQRREIRSLTRKLTKAQERIALAPTPRRRPPPAPLPPEQLERIRHLHSLRAYVWEIAELENLSQNKITSTCRDLHLPANPRGIRSNEQTTAVLTALAEYRSTASAD
jgi:uncharacterized coiled-coil protein SlyX